MLSTDLQRKWRNIAKQCNNAPALKINRHIGPRRGNYNIVVCTDASRNIYGCVLYLQHAESGNLSFVHAKKHLVNKQLHSKLMLSLELHAVNLGVECAIDLYKDLSGQSCLNPISIGQILLFTDSICVLYWLNSASLKLEKMNKHSTFFMNRIQSIQHLCEVFPVKFNFISGKENPADCVTRPLSYKQLLKSNYLTEDDVEDLIEPRLPVLIPSFTDPGESEVPASINVALDVVPTDHIIDITKFSNLRRLVLVFRRVLMAVQKWKFKAKINSLPANDNYFALVFTHLISTDSIPMLHPVWEINR